MRSIVSVEVIRGKKSFASACSAAAASIALLACAQATAAPQLEPEPFDRPLTQATQATDKLKKLISNQSAQALPVTSEQAQTLAYGKYPPVKTTVLISGKRETHWTLHPFDLVKLSRAAAEVAFKIEGVRVKPERVGAIMLSESSLVARTGWSSNGKTPSFGLGQLETNTANALGVTNPNDPKQSAVAIARLIAQAQRFAKAHPTVDEKIAVSLAYNTSTSLRNSLVRQGANLKLDMLPVPTQHHVKNMAYSEGLMSNFAKLHDQHEKVTQQAVLKHSLSPSPITHKESSVNTAHRPAPSTLSLISALSTDRSNAVRIENNQKSLEKSGHVQSVPMTSKGLDVMNAAIAAHIQRATMTNPAAMTIAATILPKVTEQIAKIAAAIQGKVTETLQAWKVGTQTQSQSQELRVSPDKTDTKSVMATAKDVAMTTFSTARQMFQTQRAMRLEQLRDQQRPA